MATTLAGQTVCRGQRLARDAAPINPRLSITDVNAQLRIGAFLRPLPVSAEATIRLASAMFQLAMRHDPRLLDRPPRVETAYGEIPVLLLERCPFLEKLHANPTGNGGKNLQLLLAANMLERELDALEEAWKAKLLGLWHALREAEMIASQLLSAHLTLNLGRAHEARTRYLVPKSVLPNLRGDDFTNLMRAIRTVAAARRRVELDDIKTEQQVVTALSMAISAVAVASALQRGAIFDVVALDRTAWDQIAYATQLTKDAARNTAEAATAYLQVLRREAQEHPIVLVLDHRLLTGTTTLAVARAIDAAVRDAEEAIGDLREDGANEPAIPEQRGAQDLTCSGLAQRLVDANRLNVWKLPFFIERALLELPRDQALDVVSLMRVSAEMAGGQAIEQSLALFGIEAAMMVAPAAGPIGIGLALAWALFSLGKTIQEYQQLSDLYHATLDPAVLLRGLEHEEASKLGIVLDLIGLMVW